MTRRTAAAALVGIVVLGTAGPGAAPRRAEAVTAQAPIIFDSSGGIEAVDQDGTNRRVLVADGGAADRSADGRELVFVRGPSGRDDNGELRSWPTLHTATFEGGDVRPVGAGDIYGTNPRWSPDGRRISFDVRPADGATSGYPELIAVVDRDGRNREVVAAGADADWSPDGSLLVFVAHNRLWTVPPRAGAPATAITPVTDDLLVSSPRWSPDGSKIAFGGSCLGVVHPDGSGFRCDSEWSSGGYRIGGWDPTGREVAYSWGGFHQWHGLRWTDPATGEIRSLDSLTAPTSWAHAPGPATCTQGYWLLGRDGGVFTFGTAAFHGSTGGLRLNRPVVGLAPTVSGDGYWLVASDGGIFTFGDAGFFGSTGAIALRAPVVGMAATPSGRGYWLVASDGGIFTFGDAGFFGSTGALRLKAPVVGMAATPSGRGYWLVASDGGVFTFGDAGFFGSTGALELAQPIVGMTSTDTGRGYTLVGRDGGTFAFGDARFPGSATYPGLPAPVAAATATAGDGLLLATTTGEVVAMDAARFCGSVRSLRLAAPIVGAAAR